MNPNQPPHHHQSMPMQQQQPSPMRYPNYPPQQQQPQQRQIQHPHGGMQSIDCIPKPAMMNQPQGGGPGGPNSGGGAGCLPSPMPLSQQQQHDQTMMWASQNYVMPPPYDSGFQSRATQSVVSSACFSGVSSITGLESGIGPEYYGAYSGVDPNGPPPFGPNGGGQAGEMTPAAGYDARYGMGPPTMQQQQHHHGFPLQPGPPMMHPDSYGEDEQVASGILELGRLLLDEDRQTVKKTALTVYSAAKQPGYARLFVQNPKMIDAIVAAMMTGKEARDYDLLKSTLGTLYLISNSDESQRDGLDAIIRSGAVPHLVAFLGADFEPMLYYTVTILHNLLLQHPNAKEAIRLADPVPSFVRLLERDHDKFLAIVTDSLRILAQTNQDTKLLLYKNNAHIQLIRILNHSNYEKLLWMTSRLIQTLCTCQYNKPAIIEAGGMHALTKHLAHVSPRVVLTCLLALRDLSDAATYVENLNPLLERLIQYFGVSDQKVLDYCLSILYNLTCKNGRNKEYVCRHAGLESLTRVLREHWNIPSIAENAMGILRHLTWKWSDVQASRNTLRTLGCLPLIGRYLDLQQLPREFHQHPKVMSEALSLLRNLAMSGGASWEDFRHYRIVEVMANLTCHIRLWLNKLMDQPQLMIDYMEVMDRAYVALSTLCQYGENQRILVEHRDIVDMSNDLAINGATDNMKDSAKKFLIALSTPPQIDAAMNAGMNDPMGGDMDQMAYEQQNLHYQPQQPQPPPGAQFHQQQQQQAHHQQFQQHPQQIHQHQQPQPHHHDQQQHHQQHHHQQQQPSVPTPSPMSWPQQQDLASASFAGTSTADFDPASHDMFDYSMPSDLNDMDTTLRPSEFGLYDGSSSIGAGVPPMGHDHHQRHPSIDMNAPGASSAYSSAVEPMQKLHL